VSAAAEGENPTSRLLHHGGALGGGFLWLWGERVKLLRSGIRDLHGQNFSPSVVIYLRPHVPGVGSVHATNPGDTPLP
jgi:hypothetical protein